MNLENSIPNLKKLIRNPIFLGVSIGFLAALSQALLFNAGGPEAYGFCVACHTRDLVNDGLNELFGMNLGVAPLSANAIAPALSIVGVMIGAFVAAKANKEFKIKKSSAKSYIWYLFGGIFVMFFALFLGACPYRAALRFAYGDMVALIGILAIALGVFVGVKIVQVQIQKEVEALD